MIGEIQVEKREEAIRAVTVLLCGYNTYYRSEQDWAEEIVDLVLGICHVSDTSLPDCPLSARDVKPIS